MDNDQQRDWAEERYWDNFCGECDTSPCSLSHEYAEAVFTLAEQTLVEPPF